MNKDEILLALRFVAMGRPNHPAVEALAQFLADHKPADAPAEDAAPKRTRKKAE